MTRSSNTQFTRKHTGSLSALKHFLPLFLMLEQIFIEFPGRVFHSPRFEVSGDCPICAAVSDENAVVGQISEVSILLKPPQPYVPGHLLLAPRQHISDLARAPDDVAEPFFEDLRTVSDRLGGKYWIFANVGWVAGQEYPHFVAHVLPDPWHVPDQFSEERERPLSLDPFTDLFTDGLRFKKFFVRYGDAHMSGLIVSSLREFRRAVGAMRAKFSRMRQLLHAERVAMLDAGHFPHVGYHLLVVNYNGPQFVVIPRVFVPKQGRWSLLDIIYNADLSVDLDGQDADAFLRAHDSAVADLSRQILK